MTSKSSSANAIRLVLDSNLYIAASSPHSHIAQFVFSAKGGINPYKLYVSPDILAEVEGKLIDKFQYPKFKAVTYIKSVLAAAELVYPTEAVDEVEQDPDDNRILECALEAAADMIVSADKDLLRLKQYQDITIAHPSQLKYIFPDVFSE